MTFPSAAIYFAIVIEHLLFVYVIVYVCFPMKMSN